MARLRRTSLRAALAPVAWASLLLLSGSQAALFVEAAQGAHGYCVEHDGAVHHLDGAPAQTTPDHSPIALVQPGQKKSAADAAHDHCEALGTGLRPSLKPTKNCTPRFEKQPLQKTRTIEARPITQEPIYARAPKTSPPLV